VSLFKRNDSTRAPRPSRQSPRSSSGWGEILALLKDRDELRVLDFGATSSANINYLTSLGHSVYMANIVEDAAKPEWRMASAERSVTVFDIERFVATNLDFSGRDFDVVLLWDTADYLPPEVVPALFEKMWSSLRLHGRLLAFFHGQADGPECSFARYQLTDSKDLVLLPAAPFPIQKTYHVRQIEGYLKGYADVRFFLGKDNIREVIATR
jgi:hypothetical protein